jgi:hypothetical protein
MWKLRYWEPEQARPTVIEVYDDRGIGADLQHAIDNQGCTRVEAVRRGHPAEPKKKPPIKAQSIEWRQEAHPKGELWVGYIGDRKVADVFRYTYESSAMDSCNYSLFLGGGDDERFLTCSSIESGKRSAQRALNKVVQALVGGV